ncbi:MAG: hypothetical protein R3B93_07605 [Bacteroidia bacterium]
MNNYFNLKSLEKYISFLEGITNKNIDAIEMYQPYPREVVYQMLMEDFFGNKKVFTSDNDLLLAH